ncbi:MAG TPA: lysophospholipid acyltransferase family protein, partial [Gammaproteobacteria bacterium]
MRPRDLLTWTLYGLLRLLFRLPWRWRLALGRGLGGLLHRVLRGPRHTARVNLRLVHPELDPQAIEALVKRHFRELGMAVFELTEAWWADSRELEAMVDFDGLEHLEAARASGRGVLLLTPHLTNLELGARFVALRLPFVINFKPDKDPLVDRLIRGNRARVLPQQVPADDVRGMLRALQEGRAMWYAPDIDYKGQGRLFVDFLGVPASMAPQAAKIAARGDALVLPYMPLRRPDGRYTLLIEPPLSGFPSGDAGTDTRRLGAALEGLVRRRP